MITPRCASSAGQSDSGTDVHLRAGGGQGRAGEWVWDVAWLGLAPTCSARCQQAQQHERQLSSTSASSAPARAAAQRLHERQLSACTSASSAPARAPAQRRQVASSPLPLIPDLKVLPRVAPVEGGGVGVGDPHEPLAAQHRLDGGRACGSGRGGAGRQAGGSGRRSGWGELRGLECMLRGAVLMGGTSVAGRGR